MSEANDQGFQHLSDELKTEFYSSVKEAMEELDHCFSSLNCNYDPEIVNQMFRAVHSVKGNCHMVFLDSIADVCHRLEDLVDEFRKGKLSYTPVQGEFIAFVFTRLEQLVADRVNGIAINSSDIELLEKGVLQVLKSDQSSRDDAAQATLESFSGILTATQSINDSVLDKLEVQEQLKDFDDLGFMEKIAKILQSKSIQQQGDLSKLISIGSSLNKKLEYPESDDQLMAAFSFQNLGSKFVPSPVFDIGLESAEWEKAKAKEQLELSAGFLKLGGKWLGASKLIEYSFERFDGRGPYGKKGKDIPAGSMILSMLKFYQQNYLRLRKDHKPKIAVAKTISRINSESGYRFDPKFVELLTQLGHSDPHKLTL
ncbi:Hpt domain-containing protein [Neptuniibacter sp. QD29_5]|uniref:Hpt domain-containing protein n=1 Tax=Neptuniibacter sp. QD29_5 TaxID=3398207 RepID=UPI0039F494B5